MAAEGAVPDRFWQVVRWVVDALAWMLPLVMIEKLAEGHNETAAGLAVAAVLDIAIAAMWNRRRHMAFLLIGVGAICLAGGIYLLAMRGEATPGKPPVAATAPPVAVGDISQWDGGFDRTRSAEAQVAIARQYSAQTREELRTALDMLWKSFDKADSEVNQALNMLGRLWSDAQRFSKLDAIQFLEQTKKINDATAALFRATNYNKDYDDGVAGKYPRFREQFNYVLQFTGQDPIMQIQVASNKLTGAVETLAEVPADASSKLRHGVLDSVGSAVSDLTADRSNPFRAWTGDAKRRIDAMLKEIAQ